MGWPWATNTPWAVVKRLSFAAGTKDGQPAPGDEDRGQPGPAQVAQPPPGVVRGARGGQNGQRGGFRPELHAEVRAFAPGRQLLPEARAEKMRIQMVLQQVEALRGLNLGVLLQFRVPGQEQPQIPAARPTSSTRRKPGASACIL